MCPLKHLQGNIFDVTFSKIICISACILTYNVCAYSMYNEYIHTNVRMCVHIYSPNVIMHKAIIHLITLLKNCAHVVTSIYRF